MGLQWQNDCRDYCRAILAQTSFTFSFSGHCRSYLKKICILSETWKSPHVIHSLELSSCPCNCWTPTKVPKPNSYNSEVSYSRNTFGPKTKLSPPQLVSCYLLLSIILPSCCKNCIYIVFILCISLCPWTPTRAAIFILGPWWFLSIADFRKSSCCLATSGRWVKMSRF